MSLSSALAAITNTPTSKTSNVCFTLPITCQICLGKVKEPVVCPNLHAFCSMCIEIWLEKSKQCPTCRIAINKENPCRKILGGIDSKDDLLVPTDFSHSSTRKARFNNLFQQYEDEINRLNKQIDNLSFELSRLKESKNGVIAPVESTGSSSPQHDMVQMLKSKLANAKNENEEMGKERDKLREVNKKLESENVILLQDLQRLKANLNEKTSQMSSRYTVAALEKKLESYEKEIKQLQKALDKSDKYILELEGGQYKLQSQNTLNDIRNNSISPSKPLTKVSPTKTVLPNSDITSLTKLKQENSDEKLKFIKGDNLTFKNELKVVKFADKISESKDTNEPTFKPSSISNDKFYGSPSKNLQNKGASSGIVSFSDRLKKNLSFDLEIPSPLSQSLVNKDAQENSINKSNSMNYNTLLNANGERNTDFLFSPMKRLRLEEFQLEKPSFVGDETFNNTTINTTQNNFETNLSNSYNFTPSATNFNGSDLSTVHTIPSNLNVSLTPEFNDCLQLLNEAENKIQNRSSPFVTKNSLPNSFNTNLTSATLNSQLNLSTNDFMRGPSLSSTIIPEKYLRSNSNHNFNNGDFMSKVAPMSTMIGNNFVTTNDNYISTSVNNQKNDLAINSFISNKTSCIPSNENLFKANYGQLNSNSVDNLGPFNTANSRSRSVEPAFKK